MPTFSAIALDQLIEPGASKATDRSDPHSVPTHKFLKPPPHSKHESRNNAPTAERKLPRPQISPALYATPTPTPLPDSPSSFPPSPYIINHKRRGPRLMKSSSEDNVTSHKGTLDEEKVNGNVKNEETKSCCSTKDPSVASSVSKTLEEEHVNGGHDCTTGNSNRELETTNGDHVSVGEIIGNSDSLDQPLVQNGSLKLVASNSERETGEFEDFFDPQESVSHSRYTKGDYNGGMERAARLATPMGEFFDAPEELSYEGPQTSLRDIEADLREIKLSLSIETEKRKQAEGSLYDMKSQWERIRQQLASVGLTLPADLTVQMGQHPDIDPAEELCQQVYLTRFVSESIGRGIAKAEVEKEMETQVEAKNFEIARLLDRLHYYEAVNQEMSQRNQEAVEMARRQRQERKRKQMRVWGSVAALVTLGSAAALVWSYLPANGSSSASHPQAPERGDATK